MDHGHERVEMKIVLRNWTAPFHVMPRILKRANSSTVAARCAFVRDMRLMLRCFFSTF